MTDLAFAVSAALAAGLSIVPPREDGTKAPLGRWKRWTTEIPSLSQVEEWYSKRGARGLGVVTGAVSGNLEMLEFEDSDTFLAYRSAADATGVGEILRRVVAGYSETTPGGGVHVLYRCDEIAGNTKLAMVGGSVAIETRGEGGFVVVAPSGGTVHPSGNPYVLQHGGFSTIAKITPEDREALWTLARTFDDSPPEIVAAPGEAEWALLPSPKATARRDADRAAGDLRPGDDLNARASWAQILEPLGWTHLYDHAGTAYWRRPGRDPKTPGASATTNHAGSDLLICHTTSTALVATAPGKPKGYSKFGAYSVLAHGGDHAAAARALGALGYGSPPKTRASAADDFSTAAPASFSDPGGSTVDPGPDSSPGEPRAVKAIVRMRGELEDVVREAEAALVAAKAPIYVRAGELVRLIRDSRGTSIRPLPKPSLLVALGQHVSFVAPKSSPKGPPKLVPIRPPREILDGLYEKGSWAFPELEAVVVAPTIRPDGSVLSDPGYDAATRLLYEPNEEFPPIPDAPSLEDAQAAIRELHVPFAEFPFLEPCDRSAALALVLSVIGRGGYSGPTPLYVVKTPTPGTGKNLLTQVVGILALKRDPPAFAAPSVDEEWSKKLGQHVRAGHRFTVVDECVRLESRAFASAITQEHHQDRLLGSMDEVFGRLPVYATCGNNTLIAGDFGRRSIPIELDSKRERPEARSFAIEDLPTWAHEHRARLVAAALTVLRAYVAAGRPPQRLSPLGSFERWNRFISAALVWAGETDPVLGQARLRKDSDVVAGDVAAILTAWSKAFAPYEKLTSRDLALKVTASHPDLLELLLGLERDPRQRDKLRPRNLGYALRGLKNRPVAGLALRSAPDPATNSFAWWVEPSSDGPDRTHDNVRVMSGACPNNPIPSSSFSLDISSGHTDMKYYTGETNGPLHGSSGTGDATVPRGSGSSGPEGPECWAEGRDDHRISGTETYPYSSRTDSPRRTLAGHDPVIPGSPVDPDYGDALEPADEDPL